MTSDLNPYEATATDPDARPSIPARQQLLPIAIALLVTSILHITGGLYYFVYAFMQVAAPEADPAHSHGTIVYCMYMGISMLYCLLLVTGAFSMMRRGSYLWAMSVCILALVPFLGPCYFFAVPIGIWGIVVLRRPEVRESFTRG